MDKEANEFVCSVAVEDSCKAYKQMSAVTRYYNSFILPRLLEGCDVLTTASAKI